MPRYVDLLGYPAQTAAATATNLNTSADTDIFTSMSFLHPVQVTFFGAEITTAFGSTPTTAAKWQLHLLDRDGTTETIKAAMAFDTAQANVGNIQYVNLVDAGLDFTVRPGEKVRVNHTTAGVNPGGSATGAARPLITYERISQQPLEDAFSWVTKKTPTAS